MDGGDASQTDRDNAVSTRPTGVVFADIVDSTGLIRRLGETEARRVVLESLDALRPQVASCGGRVLDQIGDEIMSVFPTAAGTLLAVVRFQRAVMAGRIDGTISDLIRLRIGGHFGPTLHEGGAVFGETVHMARRLASLAKAEQCLVSEELALSGAPAEDWIVRPVEETLLKGSSRPWRVYEVVWDLGRATVIDPNPQTLGPSKRPRTLCIQYGEQELLVDRDHPHADIGRDPVCDLTIQHARVSRIHLRIELRKSGFVAVDKSANGSRIVHADGQTRFLLRDESLLGERGEIVFAPGEGEEASPRIVFREI